MYQVVMNTSMATKTMKQRVLEYLEKYRTITSWEAYSKLGCTRISEYIRQLRADGYLIKSVPTKSKNRYGEISSYATYTLVKEEGN